MKNTLFFILLILNLSSCSQTVEKEGLLWKITGKGLKQPSYLFGTFHGSNGIGADFLDSIHGFYDAFNVVTQFVGESSNPYDAFFPKAKEHQGKDYGELSMPTDTTYKDLLSTDDYQYLDSIIRLSGPSGSTFFKLRPYYLWIIISGIQQSEFIKQNFGKPKSDVMDFYLFRLARRKEYEVKGLDSPEVKSKIEKLRYGNEEELPFPQSLQESADTLINKVKMIDKKLKEYDVSGIIEYFRNIEDAYKRQDLFGMEKLNNERVKMAKNITFKIDMDFLLKERNLSWIEQIPELISSQPTMIGVGAAHLYGKDGLINLLRPKGYQLENVK